MYPNPQDALPLPPRPSLDHYNKHAQSLVMACTSGSPAAIRGWAVEWIEALAELRREADGLQNREQTGCRVDQVAEFARTNVAGDGQDAACAIAAAQFVIARVHGFANWP
jgi:hypothetical protein